MFQMVTTVLAPTPMVAANFIILGRIVTRLGASYSRIPPRLYTIIFCTCDFVTLAIQGTGGGMASTADDPTTGSNILLAGIVLQLVVIIVYSLFALEFFWRYLRDRPLTPQKDSLESVEKLRPKMTLRLKAMSWALGFSTICLIIRSIYRVIELVDGWDGRIISTELYFNVLDGAMIVLAIYTMNIIHPGTFLYDHASMSREENRDRGLSFT